MSRLEERPREGPQDVVVLVRASAEGDQEAWGALADRYAGLVLGVTRQFRLSPADAEDVSQTVWLRLVEHLPTLREARALAGWLVTTTRHECLRQLRKQRKVVPVDPLVPG